VGFCYIQIDLLLYWRGFLLYWRGCLNVNLCRRRRVLDEYRRVQKFVLCTSYMDMNGGGRRSRPAARPRLVLAYPKVCTGHMTHGHKFAMRDAVMTRVETLFRIVKYLKLIVISIILFANIGIITALIFQCCFNAAYYNHVYFISAWRWSSFSAWRWSCELSPGTHSI